MIALTILTISPNSTNGSLTARSATFGKVRGSRDGARSARRRIRGRTHAPSRTSAVCASSFTHASSTGQFELDRIEQTATFQALHGLNLDDNVGWRNGFGT